MNGIFITGTDTGIGKTYFTLACIRALQEAGIKVAAMKPVASGADMMNGQLRNEDALQIQQALSNDVEYSLINPYCFSPPVSPHIAAAQAGVKIEPDVIKQQFNQLCSDADYAIVEGVGGWLAPISNESSVADLARSFDLPVVMVVGIRLGCLNHALLTAQAIKSSGLGFAGWVANIVEPGLTALDEQIDYLTRTLEMSPMVRIGWQSSDRLFPQCLPGIDI